MKLLQSWTACLALFLFWNCSAGSSWAQQTTESDSGAAILLKTKAGLRYGVWPKLPEQPVPTLFILGSSVEEVLNVPYFRQCGNQLAKQGVLCVSVDLPGHGEDVRTGEPGGLDSWRSRCEKGEDFVAPATDHFRAVLDELIELKYADPNRIAVCGTSRGGYMAVQFAAADERVRCVAAFAPVTALMALREFHTLPDRDLADRLSLNGVTEKLAGRAVWLIIGDRDERVSTDASIAFCRAVTNASLKQNKPAQVDLHVIAEPRGHTTPPGATELATSWFERQLELK